MLTCPAFHRFAFHCGRLDSHRFASSKHSQTVRPRTCIVCTCILHWIALSPKSLLPFLVLVVSASNSEAMLFTFKAFLSLCRSPCAPTKHAACLCACVRVLSCFIAYLTTCSIDSSFAYLLACLRTHLHTYLLACLLPNLRYLPTS